MKTTSTLFTLFLGVLIASSAFSANAEKFKMIHVADLASQLDNKNTQLTVYDVNTPEIRKNGIIPGAHLLSSSNSFDVAKELPADKNSELVFYCANTKCMASHAAANRAIKAGYTDVSVMADGIQGWIKAKKNVEKPNS